MKINFIVNDYALIWNLLFQASISESIYKLKQRLWKIYKDEYNNTYRDKAFILKDPKNFIPNDDTIYNTVIETKDYERIKRNAEKYRLEIMQIWDSKKKETQNLIKKIIKKDISNYQILIVNRELNVVDATCQTDLPVKTIVFGKEIDKKEPSKIIIEIIMTIINKEIKSYPKEQEDIKNSIIELAILNEYATNMNGRSCYLSGSPELSEIKRQLYPYWLMFLGVPKNEFLNYMMRDNIAFDLDKYAYEKELKKMDIEEFIDFCIRNKRYMIRTEKIEVI